VSPGWRERDPGKGGQGGDRECWRCGGGSRRD
jgi:hypothetical protein